MSVTTTTYYVKSSDEMVMLDVLHGGFVLFNKPRAHTTTLVFSDFTPSFKELFGDNIDRVEVSYRSGEDAKSHCMHEEPKGLISYVGYLKSDDGDRIVNGVVGRNFLPVSKFSNLSDETNAMVFAEACAEVIRSWADDASTA